VPGSLPAAGAPALGTVGVQEDLTTLGDQDLIDALDTLREVDDVNLVSVPDCMAQLAGVTPANVQQAAIAHCEQLADRFAVLDALAPAPGQPLFGANSVDEQRNGLDSERGYGALYYPWLQVRPAGRGDPVLVPPSGHVCGIMARSDNTKGVHKAPANELVNGALGVQRTMSDVDQGQLNVRGINVLRVFGAGGRVTLWGARTTATNRNWQYVNVRRLFLYCEESIQEGIRWAVFEPNNPSLWKKLKRSISEFLMRSFRDGAFGGADPETSFYVRIDEALNPESERRLGRLYIEVGIRPAYPAEFIIVRIGIWAGGSEVNEA
jgi:phage tail sheath protein FI